MIYKFNFEPKEEVYPRDLKIVVILYISENNPETKEISTGYRHKNSWYVSFTNPISFPENYTVLGWDYLK